MDDPPHVFDYRTGFCIHCGKRMSALYSGLTSLDCTRDVIATSHIRARARDEEKEEAGL